VLAGLIVAAIAITILVLLVLIILIPIKIKINSMIDVNKRIIQATFIVLGGTFGARILFENGITRYIIYLAGIRIYKKTVEKSKEEPKEAPKKKPKKKRKSKKYTFSNLFSREMTKQFKNIINALGKAIKIRELKCRLRIGLGDPAETGILFGYWQCAIAVASAYVDTSGLQMEPVFDDKALKLDSDVKINIYLIWLVVPAIKLFLSKPMRQLRR
jgi:hypothetical protein